jgi:hypothetical protein
MMRRRCDASCEGVNQSIPSVSPRIWPGFQRRNEEEVVSSSSYSTPSAALRMWLPLVARVVNAIELDDIDSTF